MNNWCICWFFMHPFKRRIKSHLHLLALLGGATIVVASRLIYTCWSRLEKISLTDHVRTEDVLFTVKEQRNTLHEISKRKANWIGHILHSNCLLRQVIEGKIKGGIEVKGIRGRIRRKLLDDLE